MPSNYELTVMEGVGVRIAIVSNGWQTSVIRRDKSNGTLYEETWPVRSRFDCAYGDARRCAPFILIECWAEAACRRRVFSFERGIQRERSGRVA